RAGAAEGTAEAERRAVLRTPERAGVALWEGRNGVAGRLFSVDRFAAQGLYLLVASRRKWRNGRRAGLRNQWPRPWGFESPLSHHSPEVRSSTGHHLVVLPGSGAGSAAGPEGWRWRIRGGSRGGLPRGGHELRSAR